ncbi:MULTISPECIES: restriction endonuclease subunit S [Peribacillus]|uniref:restriction endonuclease subunit S n=1 Tax=Peribacillus TaxID=2675229 RepID=UPI00203B0F55|nr:MULTISPECIES: restriction endonuclease subunit S [Peribacillus]MCM3169603.1 restriction endonuclease subunit S [Peribacillus frigoritolerans]
MKNKRVPEIRFPEFNENWEESKLGEIYNIYSGQTPLRSDSSNFDNPNTAWIKTTDLNNSSIKVNEENISEKAAGKLKILKKDTVLIAMYGGFNQIGRTGILTYPASINQALSALEPINEIVPYFLITELNYRVKEWKRLAASSRKDPNITKSDVEGFVLHYPSYQEQNKIGNFFNQLDDTIAIHQQELTTLKQTKQGFLQKMFPKDGESVPELRFPGFTVDWENHKLNSVFKDFIVPMRDKPKEFSGSIPWTRIEDIEGRYINGTTSGQYVSEETIKSMNLKVIPRGSLIVSASATFGIVAIVTKDLITNQTFIGLVPNANHNIDFLYTFFQSTTIQKRLKRESAGSTIFYISRKQFEDLTGSFPKLEEQERIGKFFKQLDDTITLHQQELDALQETKKAFLQKMFV